MKNMTLEHMAEACGGIYTGNEEDKKKEITGLVLDSRKVERGSAFLATKGERVDGHSFIPQVLAEGALCVICEQVPKDIPGNFIQVEDSFQALKDIGEFYRKQLSIPVIGITGSVGKTSTKEFIAGVLEQKYKVFKTEGNFNNEIGLPLMLLKIRENHQIAVLEMGINHFGEMRRLSKIAKPDICVMTNIGECHLEFLKSREGVLQAKTEIFEHMQENGTVFLNGDDDMLQKVTLVKNKKPVTFGLGKQNQVYAKEVENLGLSGSRVCIHMPTGEFFAQIKLPGGHMVQNALAAAAIGKHFGLSEKELAAGIASIAPVEGRSNIIRKKNLTLIDDCYNANPVSVRAALDMVSCAAGFRAAILGDMFELGDGEEEMHEQIGSYAVKKGLNALICVGRLSMYTYEGACREKEKNPANTAVLYYETLKEFLEKEKELPRINGEVTMLIKASHGMRFSEIKDLFLTYIS